MIYCLYFYKWHKICIPCIDGEENVMKVKKILSAVLSAAMCFSFLTGNVSADEADTQSLFKNSILLSSDTPDVNMSVTNVLSNSYQLENIESTTVLLNGISIDNNDGISTYSNSAPVAGLTYMVANSESIVNGKATTDTIIYWLWNDGTTEYTYDPDGDEIANRFVNGIYEYIIGNVTLGDEVVGFATKITEAGPHELTYYVTDSNGNTSNIVRYTIDIEPAGGNKRPICSLKVSTGPYYVNSNVLFNWSDSYDEDSGDYISAVRVRVYTNGDYELVTTNSEYYVSADNTGITLKFSETGTYGIMVSVSDNHNAWSNWIGGNIEVTEKTVQILKLADTEWSDSKYVRWKPTGSNSYMYHTLYSRLGGDICVVSSEAVRISSYTNHNGTYYNVNIAPIAEGTLFSCAETWSSATGNPNSNADPYFGIDTPRRITQEEIEILEADNKVNYIVYNPTTLEVIDFYSVLNPLIAYGWSTIGIVE